MFIEFTHKGRQHLTSNLTTSGASSETQGQLVGTTGFSWTKVYNKNGRAPGHLSRGYTSDFFEIVASLARGENHM